MRRGQAKGDSGLSVGGGLDSTVVAAHELKTPLATMRQLSLELERYTETADIRRIAQQIQLTAERSLRLTQDLTQASHLQAELFPLEPLNSRRVLTSVAEELLPLYGAHERRLEVQMPRTLPIVVSHFDLLRRILLNYADNALHYADDDGVVILEGKVLRRQEQVRFGVTDGGPHVQTARMQRSRVHSGYGRPASSGLGLMIADSFADAIGATTGVARKRSGMFYYIDVPISKQLSLV